MSDTVHVTARPRIIGDWPEVARQAAETTMDKYGPPDEASRNRLTWHNNGPWRRTVVYSEGEVLHKFPTPHHDVLEQYIPYRVPVDKFSEFSAFDSSVLIDRTKGEISARCEGEEANFLALNLANEIVRGRKDVESARQAYGEAKKRMLSGDTPEIMQKLMFQVSRGDTGEEDRAII